MVFDARTAHAKAQALEPFEFTGLDGNTYSIRNYRSLDGGQVERFQTGDESVLTEVADEDSYAAIRALNVGAQEQLAQAWMSFGGELGKEQPQSSANPRRSKR